MGENIRAISGRTTKNPISSAVSESSATSMILNHCPESRPSSGDGAGVLGPASILANGMLEISTWSPRALLKPIADFTSASICFISCGVRGL